MSLFKFGWVFRKTKFEFAPLYISLDMVSRFRSFDFQIMKVKKPLHTYSLFGISVLFPKLHQGRVSFQGDFLFLRTPSIKFIERVNDDLLWDSSIVSTYRLILRWILVDIFKLG